MNLKSTTHRTPNILIIVADQHRWDCLGMAGRYPVQTPHLDRLAEEGAIFSHAFTPIPVCGPARQAMLSGLAPESYGSLWNHDFLSCESLPPSNNTYLPVLASSGYDTSFVGKWNISSEFAPENFGYKHHIDPKAAVHHAESQYSDIVWPNSWFGDPSPVALSDSRTHIAANMACRQIRHAEKNNTPWLVRVDFQDPHLPCRPSEPFASQYNPDDMIPWESFPDKLENKPYIQRQQLQNWRLEGRTWKEWSRTVALYLGMISQVDDAVGLMLDQLQDLGVENETIVIYTSDHGDLCGGHGMIDKHYVLYDDVTRVPLLIRDPQTIKPGLLIDAFVSHLDLNATLAERCGLSSVMPGHGKSYMELLRGSKQSGRDEAVCSSNGQQFGLYTQRCIRTMEWLYVWNLTDTDELYEVSSDPGQCVNRINDHACTTILPDLRRRLYDILVQRNDPFVKSGWVRDQLLKGAKLS